MLLSVSLLLSLALFFFPTYQATTKGIVDLVQRRLPNQVDNFQFQLVDEKSNSTDNDRYAVSTGYNGTVLVQGNSVSSLAMG